MVEHPDSTASAAVSAGMAGCVQDLIADTAKIIMTSGDPQPPPLASNSKTVSS
jgi:hypothetical protein